MLITDLRKIIILKKLHVFETQPLTYIHNDKLMVFNLNQFAQLELNEQKRCLNKLILQEFNLGEIKWTELEFWQLLMILLGKGQQNTLYQHILLDILLHQPISLINGRIVKKLYNLFMISEKKFHSALVTNLAQSTLINQSAIFDLMHTDLEMMTKMLGLQYLQQLEMPLQQRLMLSCPMPDNVSDYLNYSNSELLLLFQFHAENLFPSYFKICAHFKF